MDFRQGVMNTAKSIGLFHPSNPVLSSTQLGDSSKVGSQRRRRLKRIDSDDEGEGNFADISEIRAAPFPGLTFAQSSPIARRYDESDDEEDMRRYSNSDVEMASVHSAERSRDDGEEDENGEGLDMDVKTLKQLKGISKGARKKTVRRPMPKLDPLTLLGERGLPALLKEAEKTKFSGRGHEFDDLQKLMFIYESWANRMLPKFPFTEIMERLEVVGTKREVHNALQGMRAGTWPPTVSAEFVRDDSDDSGSENERPKAKNTLDVPLNDDEIEELLRMQDVAQETATQKQSSPQPIASTSTANLEEARKEESAIERAERNRMAALARLEAKRQFQSTTPVRRAPTSLRNALKSMNPFDTST